MKKFLLIFALLCASAEAQILQQIMQPAPSGCTTPTGTNLTESWGDSTTSCWTSGPSTCNNTWTKEGSGNGLEASIISTPAGAPVNTACANSLQMAVNNIFQDVFKTVTAISSSTSFDINFTLYVSSNSIAASDSQNIVMANSASSGSSFRATVSFFQSGTQLTLRGSGATSSTLINIATATWYTVDLHLDATAASCSLSVNGGAAQTFTCNSQTTNYIIVGNVSTGTDAITYVIGNLYL